MHLDIHIGVDGAYSTYSTGGDGIHLTETPCPYFAVLLVAGINAPP